MGTLTASSSLSTNSGASSTKDVVNATTSGLNNDIDLGTDSVTWTVTRSGANVIGETISVINTSNCSVSPSSPTTMGINAVFTVNSFSGSSYSAQVSVTDTENFITYYAKLQGSVSDSTWTLAEANGLTQLSEGTQYAFDWTSNFTLNSGTLAFNRTRFQEAAATLGTGASSGTINLTTNNITNATADASVTLRYNSTSGARLALYEGTIYNSPPAPSISFSNITETSITVTASGSGGTLQVSDDGTNWDTNGTTYSGLTHTTSYTFYAREVNGPAISPTASASQSTLDATPSTALQLGGWKANATRNIYYYASCGAGAPTTSEGTAGSFTVTGIDSGANVLLSRAFISGTATSAQHKVNSGSWTSSNVQLVNGDTVKFRILAPSTYATSVRYDWTVENLNTDNLQITTESAPDAPGAPTDIAFSPASTASSTTSVAATASGGTGVINSTFVRQGTSGSWSANGSSFSATRGVSTNYQAYNSNDGGNSNVYTESYTAPYLATDSSINAVSNVTIPFTATNFAVVISPAESNQVYELRTGSATGTLRASSAVGSGSITCSSGLPAATNPVGSPVTYYVTTYRTTASGGSGASVNTTRTFTVTRTAPTTAPTAFELGGPITGVEVSSGNYESDTITVEGINASTSISITGGQYKIGTGSYTSSSGTVSLGNEVTVRVTAAATNSTTTTATLNIGGTIDTFSVTTEAPPPSGGTEGDGQSDPPGTYGLRCYDSNNNITLDISDRVANEVEYITTSLSSTQTVRDITLSRAASGFIYMNPPQTVIDTTVTPAVIKDWLILDFELTTATNLRIKRQAHNNTAIGSIQLLVFND